MNEHWLVTYSKKAYDEMKNDPSRMVLSGIPEYDSLLCDLEEHPHAFVLACCMDRQAKSERVWSIPCFIMQQSGMYTIEELAELPLEWYEAMFSENSLHRYNAKMAHVFYSAVQRINKQYGGNAARIWEGKPSSAAVVCRFLQFEGVGIKIATMATNLLTRCFGIEYSDYSSIDISPDVHVLRIFVRAGLTEKNASREEVIYKARDLYSAFPGIIDASCWRLGRGYCHATDPDCENCPVGKDCPKIIDDDASVH